MVTLVTVLLIIAIYPATFCAWRSMAGVPWPMKVMLILTVFASTTVGFFIPR